MGERGLDEIEIGEDIRFKGGEKLLSGDVQDAPADELDGVVVDENVQLAVAPHRPLDGGAAAGGVAQVAGQQQAPPPELLDMGLRLGGVLLLAEVGDRHVRALLREGVGDGAPDAAVAPGDERDPVAQAAAPGGAGVLRDRPGLHDGLHARLAVLLLGREGDGHLLAFRFGFEIVVDGIHLATPCDKVGYHAESYAAGPLSMRPRGKCDLVTVTTPKRYIIEPYQTTAKQGGR